MKILLSIGFFSIAFFSCNCHHEGSGYVLDKTTLLPISGARVEVASNVAGKDTLAPQVYTDANGYFSYSHNFCKDQVSIFKEGYIGYTLHPKGDTILLESIVEN